MYYVLFQGQMTVGTTNLSKIIKEPKLLFYNRNVLHKLGLIEVHYTTQITSGKAMKSILLRLKRFHQPLLGSLPKVGLIANAVEYLLQQPDHSEVNEVMIKKGLMTSKHCKRFQKTMYIFTFVSCFIYVLVSNRRSDLNSNHWLLMAITILFSKDFKIVSCFNSICIYL